MIYNVDSYEFVRFLVMNSLLRTRIEKNKKLCKRFYGTNYNTEYGPGDCGGGFDIGAGPMSD